MPDEIVDSSKSVVTATEVAAQQWVSPVPFPGARGDLQHPVSAHCADQLIVGIVRALATGELDSESAMEWTVWIGQLGEYRVRLSFELIVRGTDCRIGVVASSGQEMGGDFSRKVRIDSSRTLANEPRAPACLTE